jgi:hypothetical protein
MVATAAETFASTNSAAVQDPKPRIAMSLADLLIPIIIAGNGLSGTYIRAELFSHRKYEAAEHRKELALQHMALKGSCD